MKAEEITRAMAEQGMRITDQRRTLAELFAKSDGYVTPKAVYDIMGKTYGGLSFDTVYRNLRIMHEMGVLEQFVFEDGIKFRARCSETHHHHHLICLQCEKTISFVFCPMDEVEGLPEDFKAVKHKFEIYGYCKDCQK
ncbi:MULTISPECIES: Fur family transcriptional regulator [Paenibacillus]|uniref:Transcriptional repressor n=1 Tax=Paenibacillus lutrae TaxID=2078573 RepID=A0A7X3FIB4_9BACL|nr:Fur family transcriptional regulator [Paenibacillus sp. FJAT-26967]MVP00191.1 transcriptional repressor [Paenibacillus lutrae]